MKIKYYGTAAAEGFPGLFCECDTCEKARAAGGKNIRTRSQALVNDKLLIDFPQDTLMHVYSYGLKLTEIENIIITHKHSDHFCPNEFNWRRTGYAVLKNKKPLNIYGSVSTVAELANIDGIKKGFATAHILRAFETVNIGGIEVTPLPALHGVSIDPFFYDLYDGEKRMLYAHDTGFFYPEVWDYMQKHKRVYDLVSLDCTYVLLFDRNNHMGIETDIEVKNKMLELALATDKTVFICNHFSHNGGATYDEFAPIAAKEGFLTSFDTMEAEV